KQFEFYDYNANELLEIAKLIFEKEELTLEKAAEKHLEEYIKKLLENKHKYFGNARTIRKIVEETIRKQHLRMAGLPASQRTPKKIQTIKMEDISGFQIMEEDLKPRRGIGFR